MDSGSGAGMTMDFHMKQFFGRIMLEYLRFFAKWKLSRIHPKIIGITGSVGKTSAINALHTILSPTLKTKTTFKGNSESGIPLEILNIKLKDFSFFSWLLACVLAPIRVFDGEVYDVLIVEMGVDAPYEPKNMSYLLKIIRPDIGIILNVSAVHTEQFKGDVEAIAGEKSLLVTTMDSTKTAILNGDDRYLQKIFPKVHAEIFTFGRNKDATLRISDCQVKKYSTTFTYNWINKILQLKFDDQLFFEEYGYIFAAILLAAWKLGIPFKNSIERLEKEYRLPPGRLSVLKGEKQSTIIDSSYNASPVAVSAALHLVKNLSIPGKKIVVLGDMRELGVLEEEKHRELGIFASQSGDFIVLVGPLMKKYALPAILNTGFSHTHVFSFDTAKDVGQFLLKKLMKRNDLVLVKGSQNTIFLEQVVYELMKEKNRSHELLCRQSEYWQQVRNRFFSKHKL
jgi:UDP-N-acetylmuramoyl-tripeptide--D-alanyl-D-alanine ligase